MPKLLEVIVTSAEEAREAEEGGADRLELVRDLAQGGLTPSYGTACEVLSSVRLPVRAMVRENAGMSIESRRELDVLASQTEAFSSLPLNGLVLGFLRDRLIDHGAMTTLLAGSRTLPVTFHRAFEQLADPDEGFCHLRRYRQVDRVLVRVSERFSLPRLEQWQSSSPSGIRFIAGVGLAQELLNDVRTSAVEEIHVGRLVREPVSNDGRLSRDRVAALKSALR